VKVYLAGGYTKQQIWKMYTGGEEEHGQLLQWMRKLGYLKANDSKKSISRIATHELYLQKKDNLSTKSKSTTERPEDLQKRIKELEKALETANLRAEGYELMIDIAEKELNIPIRKKFDAK
jgi:hypothetical protein